MKTKETNPVGRVTPCAPSDATENMSGARGATRPTIADGARGATRPASFLKAPRTWLVTAALLATVAGVFVARTAFARIGLNTINPVPRVSDQGRHLTVTGPLAFTAGEAAYLRVTVTQRATGAVAEGDAVLSGTGTTNQWQVQATTQGKAVFAPGPARAVALAVTTTRGETTDANQWLADITLVNE